jgi:hypothetical protein
MHVSSLTSGGGEDSRGNVGSCNGEILSRDGASNCEVLSRDC